MQPNQDLLAADEAELKSLRRRRKLLIVAIVFGALLPFIYGVWFAYDKLIGSGGRGEPPLIKAETGPIKVAPADPGGVAIPNQDKQVYDRVKGGEGQDRAADRLLPPPERSAPLPLPPPPGAQDLTKSAAVPPVTNQLPPPPKAAAAAPATLKPPSVYLAPVQSTSAAKTIRIQTASFRDTISAIAAWKVMERQHPGTLNGLTPTYERVELGDKGVYHRVQAGPFADTASAEAVCVKLRAAKQDCIVVAR